ncbi:MAG TPA: peptidyl-prolyl cis-trans isomerase, partial [Polymorphobacter sp.]|nr:peptidyl-prolyl cis-trans isomerase [Polymorphobacter sp.]
VESGLGWHLVRLRKVEPGATPTLEMVRQRVENDWRADNRRRAEAAAYQALLDGYNIKIEKPGS